LGVDRGVDREEAMAAWGRSRGSKKKEEKALERGGDCERTVKEKKGATTD